MSAIKKEDDDTLDFNISPILLFSVKRKNEKRGVYYVPQRGVALEGIVNDWSVLTVIKNISDEQFEEFEPQEINPGNLEETSIVKALASWMSTDEEQDVEDPDYEE